MPIEGGLGSAAARADFRVGEVVAIDEELGTIIELYGLQAEGSDQVHRMASVKMENGEICEYLLVDLGRVVEIRE